MHALVYLMSWFYLNGKQKQKLAVLTFQALMTGGDCWKIPVEMQGRKLVVKADWNMRSQRNCVLSLQKNYLILDTKKMYFTTETFLVVIDIKVTRNGMAHREKKKSERRLAWQTDGILFSERWDTMKSNSLKLWHWKIGINDKRICAWSLQQNYETCSLIFRWPYKKSMLLIT